MVTYKFSLITAYPKNILRIVSGFIMACLSFYVAYTNFMIKPEINVLQVSMLPIFLLSGIFYIIIGLGINPISFFGKAYIYVSSQGVIVKPSITKKQWQLNTNEISDIKFKVASIQFNNNRNTEFEFGRIRKSDIQDIKSAMIIFAKENNIKLS